VTTNFAPWLFRIFDRCVDHYVAIGEACRQLLIRHVRKPIASIPNGVPATFSQAGARPSSAHESLVLAVGNLNPKKDYTNLVEAAALALPRLDVAGRHVRIAIAGEGPDRRRIEQLVQEHGLQDRFKLLGARSDVAALMRQADLLANSSQHEGLPITLIEAAMSGLPIVATNVGGNAEVVLDGRTGFVVPPARPDLLADGIIKLLSDGALYGIFSAGAVSHSRQFLMDSCATAHLDLYQALIKTGVPSGSAAAR
jgi:glycosyltransferase involved in cell wall biosynthesis